MLGDAVAAMGRRTPYFRGKSRILNALTPKKGIRSVEVFGLPMELDLSEVIQRQVFLGCYEHHDTELVRRHLPSGGVFVDVGANIGWFTAAAASIVGRAGRVVAFEPSPYAFGLLNRAIGGCGERVQAFNIGLSDEDGELRLFVPPESYGNHDPSVVEYCAGMTPITVPVRRLAGVLANLQITRVDVMKVDVEAHEFEVFAGCESILRSGGVRTLLCEFNDPLLRRRGHSSAELLSYLRDTGFEPMDTPSLDGQVENLLLRFVR